MWQIYWWVYVLCHVTVSEIIIRGEAQDVERVAYLLSIDMSVEKPIFKNRPIRQLGAILGRYEALWKEYTQKKRLIDYEFNN